MFFLRRAMTKPYSTKVHNTKSLAHASLEIGRVLAESDGVSFRADGTCMYPTIRPGDKLHIQARPAGDVCVGDIAVCRRPKYLFSHRVIAKGSEDGRAYIVTCPDRRRHTDDGPTFDEDLLGVVVDIKRKGTSFPLQPGTHPWPVRRYFAARLTLMEIKMRAHLGWLSILARVQENALYRYIAGAWFSMAHSRISYSVRVPMPALGDAVYRQMTPESFNGMDWRGRPVKRWTLALHVNGTTQPVAWMTLTRDASDNWSAEESFVRTLYRGAGLDEPLQRRAETILLQFRGENKRARGLKGDD